MPHLPCDDGGLDPADVLQQRSGIQKRKDVTRRGASLSEDHPRRLEQVEAVLQASPPLRGSASSARGCTVRCTVLCCLLGQPSPCVSRRGRGRPTRNGRHPRAQLPLPRLCSPGALHGRWRWISAGTVQGRQRRGTRGGRRQPRRDTSRELGALDTNTELVGAVSPIPPSRDLPLNLATGSRGTSRVCSYIRDLDASMRLSRSKTAPSQRPDG